MLKLIVLLAVGFFAGGWGQFQWQNKDVFDEVKLKMDKITASNCHIKHRNELFLDMSVISHLPDIKDININPVMPNRTALLQVHNLALNRAFFYSFILQRANDEKEPGFMYYYLSTIADVAANSKINASAIYFSPNMSYTPSYKGFYNKTMPLFAPRAFRADDFNDPIHLQRVSTLNTFEAADLGAFRLESQSYNYTIDAYRINDWYKAWLPDATKRQDSKTTYSVKITYANGTNDSFVWHGPPGANEQRGPVKWTRPYFDCGRSNKWIIGASVPIPDIYPRHTQFRHIEIPTYVAAAVLEMDFDRVDINQCPLGEGNPPPNKFAATDRCKHHTTECEPLHGYGFRRGGYQCRCKPGHRLPKNVRQPWLGEIVERATASEYNRLFDCHGIEYKMMMPQDKYPLDQTTRHMYMDKYTQRVTGSFKPAHAERTNLKKFFRFIREGLNGTTCNNRTLFSPSELELHGDVGHGIERQFENEARMALRLATFLSSYLQIVDPDEQFGELRLADKPLTEDQLFGEVIATVMSNVRIWSAGIYWDKNKFPNRTMFAPYVYKKEEHAPFQVFAEDLARRKGADSYLRKKWFKHLKSRWATGTEGLKENILKIKVRANQDGEYSTNYDHYPIRFHGPNLSHGYWTSPYYDCGNLNLWVVTYAIPFFGWDSIRNKLEFKGVVAVTSWINKLDIDQCSENYLVSNAFKDTHKCDQSSSYCIPILGRGFMPGGYKCECLQGYEYPYENPITYYDGQLVEAEYENLVANKESWFDTLKCRIAGASSIHSCFYFTVMLLLVCAFVY